MKGYLINENVIIGKDIPYVGKLDSSVMFATEFLKPSWWINNVNKKNMKLSIRTLDAQIQTNKKNYFNTESQEKSIEIIKRALEQIAAS